MRAIGKDGEQLGILPIEQALSRAEDTGLDLVEVAPDAQPPVCRIMDYGRYRFQQEKRHSEGKKHQATVTLKEIKLRPKTGEHDFQVKLRRITSFLKKGHKVKVTCMFRGREIVHAELGERHLLRIIGLCEELGNVDSQPKMDGRTMIMILTPKKS